MKKYPINPCAECEWKTTKYAAENINGLIEGVKRPFCSKKRIFIDDRTGPCTGCGKESA